MSIDTTKEKLINIKLLKIILFCVVSIFLFISIFYNNQINSYFNCINLSYFKNCNLTVHFLDVGQADCTIIQFPNNELMIIDAGAENGNSSTANYICDYIKNNFRKNTIKYLILTHSDEDHCLSIPLIMKEFNIKNIYRPATKALFNDVEQINENEPTNICYSAVYAEVIQSFSNEENCTVIISRAGLTIKEANAEISFLAPNKDKYLNGENSNAMNAISAVIQLNYNNRSFLFTGDSNEYNETELLNNCSDIDVLKVAHHGSSTSTTTQFLEITVPEFAVFSVGANNSYNMPSSKVYSNLLTYMEKRNIFRTDLNGTVIFGIDLDSNIKVKTCNFQNNKVIWWQVVLTTDFILFISLFVIQNKKFNDIN